MKLNEIRANPAGWLKNFVEWNGCGGEDAAVAAVEGIRALEARALTRDAIVKLWLARHALIEYAAQVHPYAGLIDLVTILSGIVEALPGAASALEESRVLCAEGGPFRSGDALRRTLAEFDAKKGGRVSFIPTITAVDEPIRMFLTCPKCNARHIDQGEYATKPHHTHACQVCGLTWRPAICATVGVQFLPGFKDEASEPSNG